MKRSELYDRVWTTPMSRLAKELGVSDVGLAKACRRNAIPTPVRGYWAKLQAGHKMPKPALPHPDRDVEVDLSVTPKEVRVQREAERDKHANWVEQHAAPTALPPLSLPESLDGAHPLVRATAKFCERIPLLEKKWARRRPGDWSSWKDEDRPPHADHGRYHLFQDGCLNIRASLENMDWVLRFHASVIAGLEASGFKIGRRKPEDAGRHGTGKAAAVVATLKTESFELEFSEGYRRVPLTKEEIAKRTKETGYAPYSQTETVPSGKYTFRVTGTEHRARDEWQGTAEKLQARLNEIVRRVIELAALQPLFRTEREQAAAAAQREAERREAERRITEARAEQVKRAFAMAEEHERVVRLEDFLRFLDTHSAELQEPYAERLKVWLTVVREELAKKPPLDRLLLEVLTVPSWQKWPPNWWPIAAGGTD